MKFKYPRIQGWQDAEKNFLQIEVETTPKWVAVTHENSWVDYGSGYQGAEYWKDNNGFVHVRGFVKTGTPPSTVFTLPTGFRPKNKEVFAVIAYGTVGQVDVDTDGTVDVIAGSSTYTSLSGITFAAV